MSFTKNCCLWKQHLLYACPSYSLTQLLISLSEQIKGVLQEHKTLSDLNIKHIIIINIIKCIKHGTDMQKGMWEPTMQAHVKQWQQSAGSIIYNWSTRQQRHHPHQLYSLKPFTNNYSFSLVVVRIHFMEMTHSTTIIWSSLICCMSTTCLPCRLRKEHVVTTGKIISLGALTLLLTALCLQTLEVTTHKWLE